MNSYRKILTKLLPCIIVLLMVLAPAQAFADYYITNDILGPQRTSTTFEVSRVIYDFREVGSLNSPMDIFIDQDDYLYLLDSNNSRIIVLDPDENIDRVIEGSFGSANVPMNKPEGLYVDHTGDIFVADTQNKRILHLDPEGRFVEEFVEPDERTYDRTYPFKPSKVAVDDFGRLYILNSNDFHGIILMNGENEFLGYIASTKIVSGMLDSLIRTFATEAQQAQLAREVPAYFSNFLIHEDFIYATSFWSDSGQIRKLTPAGGNVFPDKIYGEPNDKDQFNFKPAFVDLAVDRNGIIYAAEMVTGGIYVYDSDGNNLSVFGGSGKTIRHFELISSIAVNSKGDLFILDGVNNVIQVLRPTELMNSIIEATTLYNFGDYDGARLPWSKVLKMDSTNYLANMGFAKSAYMERDYREAMTLYKNSLDPQGYSNAYYFYRLGIFRNYFFPIVAVVIVLLILLVAVFKLFRRRADRLFDEGVVLSGSFSPAGHLDIGILTFFHPVEGFRMIKRNRDKFKLWTPAILFIAFIAVRLIYVYTVHFPLSDVTAVYSDFLQQVGFLALPLLSVVFVGHILISLSDGKQTFAEMATATMYSFLPYMIFILPVSLASQFMCLSESGLFSAMNAGVWIWSISLLLLSVKTMNQYTFGKLIWTIVKILFGIISFWMICALLYIVFFQSVSLASGIYEEFVTGIYN